MSIIDHKPAAKSWDLYDRLIDGVPEGIAVTDFCLHTHWSYVEAECGMGVAKTVRGGALGPEGRKAALASAMEFPFPVNPRLLDLKALCSWSKSWCWEQATLGVAALNAFYTTPNKISALGGQVDDEASGLGKARNPFTSLRDAYQGKRVTVVGHFPNVHAMNGCGELTVLERNCNSPLDTPDSACEYVLPEQDFVFITGTTLTNKTLPRLLQLSHSAYIVIVGPSAIPAAPLLEHGANFIGGSVVVDPALAKLAVAGGTKQQWRACIKKFSLS